MKVKKGLLAIVVATAIASNTANAGWPVFDASNLMQAVTEFMQMQKDYQAAMERYDMLKQQYGELQNVKNNLTTATALGQIIDYSQLCLEYFGSEENLEQDYFAEKVNFVPDASNYYTQICLDNGHKENLVDIPEIIRNDSANIYRVQSNELAILKKYKKDSNKYSNKIDTYYTRLKASKNIKQTMDLLAEMQIDKQKFDYITKLTDSYLKKEQTRKVRYKTRIENIRRNFYFEVDANQLKQSFHSY